MQYFLKFLATLDPSPDIQLDATIQDTRVCVEVHGTKRGRWRVVKIVCHQYASLSDANAVHDLLSQYVDQFNKQCIPQI